MTKGNVRARVHLRGQVYELGRHHSHRDAAVARDRARREFRERGIVESATSSHVVSLLEDEEPGTAVDAIASQEEARRRTLLEQPEIRFALRFIELALTDARRFPEKPDGQSALAWICGGTSLAPVGTFEEACALVGGDPAKARQRIRR